jgi:hypothetical protein
MTPNQSEALLVEEFRTETNISRLEKLADKLAEIKDARAIFVLLDKLCDDRMRDDDDLEDAICSALVAHNVMVKHGNLTFTFLPPDSLDKVIAQAIYQKYPPLPRKYFD